MKEEKLIPKGDGTFYVPTIKAEDGRLYTSAYYKNVDKWCTCNVEGRYCSDWRLHHQAHVYSSCWCILPHHIYPFDEVK